MTFRPAFHLGDLDALDSASRLPLYAQLADMLAKRIRPAQERLAGRALPSELEMTRHFGISRPTVRQAMSHLLTEDLIVRGRGRGTFVAPPRASRDLRILRQRPRGVGRRCGPAPLALGAPDRRDQAGAVPGRRDRVAVRLPPRPP